MRKMFLRLGVLIAACAVLTLSVAISEKNVSAKSAAPPMAALQGTNFIYAIAVNGNDIYVGGSFEGIGGIAAKNIARFNLQSQNWFALGADLQTGGNGVNDAVYSITILGNDVYVGGRFSRVYKALNNSIGVRCVAKWNIGSASWSALGNGSDPQGNGVNGDVNASIAKDGIVYFVGGFKNAYHTASNFVEVNNVAAWNPVAGTWTALGKGIGTFAGDVKAITVIGNNIFIGGQFPFVVRPNDYHLHVDCIARWDVTTKNWFPLGVDSGGPGSNGVGGDVYSLATDGTNLYVGGLFQEAHNSAANQPPAKHIARWNGSAWSTLNNSNSPTTNGVNANVHELCWSNGILYAGGEFDLVSNSNGSTTAANYLASWNGTGWSVFGAVNNNGVDNEVHAAALVNGQLYVGGLFSEAYGLSGNTVAVPGLARWFNNTWTTVGTSSIKAMSITSAASFASGETAPDAIMSAFGNGLASGIETGKTVPLPTSLLNSRVDVHDSTGTTRAAQLFFVSPGQINFLMPVGTALGNATITLTAGDGSVSQGTVNVVSFSPGLFTYNANGQGVAAAVALRLKANGQQVYESIARYDTPTSRWVTTPINLGPVGERVFLVAYGSAFRGRPTVTPITMTMGGTASPNVFAGAQGAFAGLDQVNAEISRSLIGRNAELDVVLTVGSKTANTVKIFVQ